MAGVLKFTFDNAGRESVGSVVRNQNNQLIIRVDNDIFIVSPFPYGTDTLTLTRSAGEAAQSYSLINVQLRTGYLAQVYTDEECTQRPQVGETYSSFYVKVNKPMMAGDTIYVPSGPPKFSALALYADAEPPAYGWQFYVQVYQSFKSLQLEEGYQGVIQCTFSTPATVEEPLQVDFFPIYE